MRLKKIPKALRSLPARLSLWYAIIFALISLAVFIVLYFQIDSILMARTNQALLSQAHEFRQQHIHGGVDQVKIGMAIEMQSRPPGSSFFQLFTSDGDELASTLEPPWKTIPINRKAINSIARGQLFVIKTLEMPGNAPKIRTLYADLGGNIIVQIGESLKANEIFMQRFRWLSCLTIIVLTAIGTLIGWIMVKKAVSGVEEVTRTALCISQGNLEERVVIRTKYEEIDRLADTFNAMQDKIQKLIGKMNEMTDNIAHDLKSPITAVRGFAEIILTREKTPAESKSMAARMIEECERLLGIIDTMLFITEIEAGIGAVDQTDLDITQEIEAAMELFRPLAEEKRVRLTAELPGHCQMKGNRQGIQRLVANLLDNAIKYTPNGGEVTISLKANQHKVNLTFKDTGSGIREKDRPHIFTRFYRADRSRSKGSGGLGLSLAAAVAKHHGGDISLISLPGEGSHFVVTLLRGDA